MTLNFSILSCIFMVNGASNFLFRTGPQKCVGRPCIKQPKSQQRSSDCPSSMAAEDQQIVHHKQLLIVMARNERAAYGPHFC